MKERRAAMAIAAHPDDIEFLMAGTLILLGQQGFELHYMTVASGNCGSMTTGSAMTRTIRRRESKAAARILKARYHQSVTDDLEIFYDRVTLRRVAAAIRAANPSILLVPSPQDYMEDHTNTCRLAVTAAFARGMPNFRTTPSRKPVAADVTVYHAMPHGLVDPLRHAIVPDLFIDTTPVHPQKREALAAHASQKAWLDATQGMDSYLAVMDQMSLQTGRMSGKFQHAEGWRRHLHFGFSAKEQDPLAEILGKSYLPNSKR